MRARLSPLALVFACALALVLASPAAAGGDEASEAGAMAAASPANEAAIERAPLPACRQPKGTVEGEPIPAAPEDHTLCDEPWHYNTDYFFGLTRGIPEVPIEGNWRYPTMVVTVPLDVLILPGAALAGLFG